MSCSEERYQVIISITNANCPTFCLQPWPLQSSIHMSRSLFTSLIAGSVSISNSAWPKQTSWFVHPYMGLSSITHLNKWYQHSSKYIFILYPFAHPSPSPKPVVNLADLSFKICLWSVHFCLSSLPSHCPAHFYSFATQLVFQLHFCSIFIQFSHRTWRDLRMETRSCHSRCETLFGFPSWSGFANYKSVIVYLFDLSFYSYYFSAPSTCQAGSSSGGFVLVVPSAENSCLPSSSRGRLLVTQNSSWLRPRWKGFPDRIATC